jgi:hypothetical protein
MANDKPLEVVATEQESLSDVRPVEGMGGFRPGEREFYGGLAAITICCAIAMMRGGPEAGYAATPTSVAEASASPASALQRHSSPMAEPVNLAERNEMSESPSASRVRSLR